MTRRVSPPLLAAAVDARVHVAFRWDPERAAYRLLCGRHPSGVALDCQWERRASVGTVLDNAYTDRAKTIVVRSGAADLGRGVTERRDIYEDYRRLVGGEPPAIEGIAVMTDTDDTAGSGVAWHDAITLGPPE